MQISVVPSNPILPQSCVLTHGPQQKHRRFNSVWRITWSLSERSPLTPTCRLFLAWFIFTVWGRLCLKKKKKRSSGGGCGSQLVESRRQTHRAKANWGMRRCPLNNSPPVGGRGQAPDWLLVWDAAVGVCGNTVVVVMCVEPGCRAAAWASTPVVRAAAQWLNKGDLHKGPEASAPVCAESLAVVL